MSSAAPAKRNPLKPSLDWLLVFRAHIHSAAFRARLEERHRSFHLLMSCHSAIGRLDGRATEQLAEKVGEGAGGLLNATFGNAAELIIALMALSKGLTGVVKASITGSIIGNVLLVLGASFLAGGFKFTTQKFNQTAARSGATALILAAIALTVPSLFHHVADDVPASLGGWTPHKEQTLSLCIAVVLILTYIATLLFSLKTHKELFVGGNHSLAEEAKEEAEAAEHWSMGKSAVVLFIATCFVALISEFLVGAVEAARAQLGLTEVFVGVIVVAIIGNAAEHSSAIMMALRNKMDLSVGIAVGSSLQIALFVAPVLIFASHLMGRPMDLEFTIPEVVAMGLAIVITSQIAGDGESNWLEGAQLLSVYLVLAILFYFLPESHHLTGGAKALPGVATTGIPAH